jgi:anaerobic selenocysteine-containing dehydrogenase
MLWGSATDASASNFQTARSLLILRALTGNIDCPGGDILWVPPKGVHQKSIFISPDQESARFLSPERRNRAVTLGKFPLEKALREHLKFTVVSEFFITPTAALADIELPGAMWLETIISSRGRRLRASKNVSWP